MILVPDVNVSFILHKSLFFYLTINGYQIHVVYNFDDDVFYRS